MTKSKTKSATINRNMLRKDNRKVLKAITIGELREEEVKKTQSNSLKDGDESALLSTHNLLNPPFNLYQLAKMSENSSELGQIIDAMVINIEGFGGRFIVRVSKDDRKKLNDVLETEYEKIDYVFNHINPDYDLTELRKRYRADMEKTGNGYAEIVRDMNNEIHSLYHVESHTIRLTKLEMNPINISVPILKKNYTFGSKMFKKRFRLFAQRRGQKFIWFKEYGDPRIYDKRTGKVSDETLAESERATELYHFKKFDSTSSYGIPKYIGNLFSIYGSRSSDEINFITFQNNNIPAMAVIVNNGQLTDGTITRIEEFVEAHVKRSKNRSAFLILEAEPQDEDTENASAMKIEIKDLTKAQQNDQLFQEYDKNNAEKIRRSFRLPPIFVGKSDDYSRNTAESSRRLADEQIFSPEREVTDFFFNKLLLDMGIKYWYFKSNSANVTDDEDLIKVLNSSEKSGAISPNLGREILSDILNKEIPPYDSTAVTFDPDVPFSLTMAEAVKNLNGLAPNQGQIPKPKNDNTEKLAKMLMDPEKYIDELVNVSEHFEKYLDDEVYGDHEQD